MHIFPHFLSNTILLLFLYLPSSSQSVTLKTFDLTANHSLNGIILARDPNTSTLVERTEFEQSNRTGRDRRSASKQFDGDWKEDENEGEAESGEQANDEDEMQDQEQEMSADENEDDNDEDSENFEEDRNAVAPSKATHKTSVQAGKGKPLAGPQGRWGPKDNPKDLRPIYPKGKPVVHRPPQKAPGARRINTWRPPPGTKSRPSIKQSIQKTKSLAEKLHRLEENYKKQEKSMEKAVHRRFRVRGGPLRNPRVQRNLRTQLRRSNVLPKNFRGRIKEIIVTYALVPQRPVLRRPMLRRPILIRRRPMMKTFPSAKTLPTAKTFPTPKVSPTSKISSIAKTFPTPKTLSIVKTSSTPKTYPTAKNSSTPETFPASRTSPIAKTFPVTKTFPTAKIFSIAKTFPTPKISSTPKTYPTAKTFPTVKNSTTPETFHALRTSPIAKTFPVTKTFPTAKTSSDEELKEAWSETYLTLQLHFLKFLLTNMMKIFFAATLLAGCVLANEDFFRRHHGSWRNRMHELDEDRVSPPNCSCSRRNETNGWTAEEKGHYLLKKFQRFAQPNETFEQFQERSEKRKMVCGTDGVTYADKCEFVNKASANPALGKRCRGPCPCDLNAVDEKREHKDEKEDRWDGEERPICLNNGTTVYGFKALQAAKKSSDSIGSRCKGECSECATALTCPRRHRKRHDRDRRNRRHFESNVTAPDCTCTLSTEPWSQTFLNSTCGKKFLEKRQVCGSDGKTYANKCDFKNAQSKNAALGKRCHGACPCDFQKQESEFRKFSSKFHESKRREERAGFRRSSKPICLSNGITVHGWNESREAIKANSSLGVRCKGECQECQSAPIRCPVDWVKIKQEKEASRPKPPNCKCPKALEFGFGRRRSHEICGNDNKTYANICELVNNQSSQASLGFRCLGKCPCRRNESEALQRIPQMHEEESNDQSHNEPEEPSHDESDESNEVEQQNDEHHNGEEEHQGEGNDELGSESRIKRDAEWGHRHHRRHRRHHGRSVCLTNGQTVRGWRNVSEAFKADASVGIRCRGHCEWCANVTRCPWFPSEEKQKEIKEHIHRVMQEKGRRWMEMTVESTEKPGKCDCSWPGPHGGMNKSEKAGRDGHRGGWGNHGRKGHGHPKMDFSVCGTDGVTYKTMCELINNQSLDKNLGFRCHGACPCPIDEPVGSDDEEENSTMSQNFKKLLEAHGDKFAFCLTNGKTVYTKRELKAALASDKTLGTRFMNECSVGDAGLKCPRVFRPFNETERKSRKEFHGKKWGDRDEDRRSNRKMGAWKRKEQRLGFPGEHHETEANGTAQGQERHRMWKGDNRTEEQRMEDWELLKETPSFQFKAAGDFGFKHFQFGGEGHRHRGFGGWGRRRHHWRGGMMSAGESCMDENEQGNSTLN
ncbi:hypothetical protein BV898_13836 [Hypsibius exemplaris]|uniref:Kazal-like domain-containing protein n=1 Tax=Hypsibius exemplaris TaxID=2072580 RepID=A0A1W0W9M7_HYPEX|nr:hypothetical protein BV898_13836 [Hypsibius exemplaris]